MQDWSAASPRFACVSIVAKRPYGCGERVRVADDQDEGVGAMRPVAPGLTPDGATWHVDASFAIDWWQADYGTPSSPRGSREIVTMEVGWTF